MNCKLKRGLVKAFENMDLFDMCDPLVSQHGDKIGITIKDYFYQELYVFEYSITYNTVDLMLVVNGEESTIDNLFDAIKRTAQQELLFHFTPTDKEIIGDLEFIRAEYELLGDQFAEYCYYVLRERYGAKKALKEMQEVVDYFTKEDL